MHHAGRIFKRWYFTGAMLIYFVDSLFGPRNERELQSSK